jgi:putative acetyltransferase
MHETVRLADEHGEPLLLIEGNPAYYGRFGFVRADEQGIEMPPESRGPQYFMLRPLRAYDPTVRGRAVYPPETFGIAY